MNLDPAALRESARRCRETALRGLDAADEDAIRADAVDALFAAEAELVVTRSRMDAAQKTGETQEATTAAFDLFDEVEATWPIHDTLKDPLSLVGFTPSPAWLARIERPEVYRAVLLAKAGGRIVPDTAFEAATAAARKSWKFDAALVGDLGPSGGL